MGRSSVRWALRDEAKFTKPRGISDVEEREKAHMGGHSRQTCICSNHSIPSIHKIRENKFVRRDSPGN